MIRARAPLRLSFGGGGTDVSPYADQRGGAVLNATINRYAYVTIAPREDSNDRTVRLRSLDYDEEVSFELGRSPATTSGAVQLALGATNRFAQRIESGFDLFTHADCPPGSGLGASSTMMVAIVGALDHWLDLALERKEVAQLAYDIERNDLGITGGRQDQYAATYGGFNFLEFTGGETSVTPVTLAREWIAELEYAMVLAYTGVSRKSGEIIADQIRNFEIEERDAVKAMDETKQLAVEMREALEGGQFRRVGRLLDAAWAVKKRMSSRISNEHIDRIYGAAMDAGALGGKISGAGGGGFAFFFAAFDRRADVVGALRREGAEVVDFGFTADGLQAWNR